MRTKVTLVLVLLNVALFFFIFKFERKWRTEAASLEARRRVLGPEAADIRSLEVTTGAPGGSFALVRQRDEWFLSQPLDWPANPHAVNTIVQELQLLEHETSFRVADLAQNNLTLADYGLDKPKVTVAFTAGSGGASPIRDPANTPPIVLRIGDTTKDGKRLYVLSPNGERVHVVNRTLLDSLSVPLDRLRADSLLTVQVFEARSLTVQTANPQPAAGGATGVRVRIRRDGPRWAFETPIIARASKTAVEVVIQDLNSLRAKTFVATPSTPPAAAPALRLTLEGNNRHETLFLGEPVAAPAANQTPSSETEYYAQLEGRSSVFTVAIPPRLVESLRNAQESLREKRLLEFDPRAVAAITISAPLLSNVPPLTLQRVEPPGGGPADAAPDWQVTRRGERDQGLQALPAERAAVDRLLVQLALLSAERFTSDAPTSADLEDWGFNRPVREVTLTFPGNAAPIVLRLGTDPARTLYARVGTPGDPGSSVYAINSEFLRELPVNAHDWRSRAVREPLPASARITALKLTDLASNQLVYETAFNAAGEPAHAPRDPKAVQDIVAAMRALRAKNFVPGGFAERIFAGGDERGWRFQLDVAVALTGSELVPPVTTTLFFTERIGGTQQFAGSKELDVVFEIEQPLLDALWSLTYGSRDPGPPPAPAK